MTAPPASGPTAGASSASTPAAAPASGGASSAASTTGAAEPASRTSGLAAPRDGSAAPSSVDEAIAQQWALDRAREIDSRSASPLGVSKLSPRSKAALAKATREGLTFDALSCLGDWLVDSHDAEWWRGKGLHVDGWGPVLSDWQTRVRVATAWDSMGRPRGPLTAKSAKAAAADDFFSELDSTGYEVIDVYPGRSEGGDALASQRRIAAS